MDNIVIAMPRHCLQTLHMQESRGILENASILRNPRIVGPLIALATGIVLAMIWLFGGAQAAAAAAAADSSQCPGPDTFGYTCTPVNRIFTPATTDIGNNCDDCVTPIDLPFAFTFYGQTYTSTHVSSNGSVQFESTNFISYTFPTDTFTQTILPFAADLCTNIDCGDSSVSGGNGIYTQTLGTAPNRVFVIEWRAHFYRPQALLPNINFELQLEEQSNNIYFVYGNSTEVQPTSWYMGGLQQGNGSGATLISFGPVDPYAPPVYNNNSSLCFSMLPDCPAPPGPATVRILKSATPAVVVPGQTITYTLVYSNASVVTATNVIISDVVPASLLATSWTFDGAPLTQQPPVDYAWTADSLAPGAGGTITITGVLTDALPPGTVVINTVSISAEYVAPVDSSAAFMVACPPHYTVTNTDDDGPGSLRRAIAYVCNGGNIDFNLTYPATIMLTSGQLLINKDLTISGPGATNLTISAGDASRVVGINPELTFVLSDVTVAHGNAFGADCSVDGCGGGIRVGEKADATLQGIAIIDSTAQYHGGGLYAEPYAVVTLVNASAISNSAGNQGGGLFTSNLVKLTLIGSNVISNSALDRGGGAYFDFSQVSVKGSTVASNTAVSNGGGFYNYLGSLDVDGSIFHYNLAFEGGAIFHQSGVLMMTNSAVYGNRALQSSGGGLSNWNDVNVDGAGATLINTTIADNWSGDFGAAGIRSGVSTTLRLINSTIAGNTAVVTNALNTNYAAGLRSAGGASLVNTIIANNNAGSLPGGQDCWSSAPPTTTTANLIPSNNGCGPSVSNTNPLLAALGDNGGGTPTVALLPGSPAIDAGADLGCPAADQRGVARAGGPGSCDIGAFESQGFSLVLAGGDNQGAPIQGAFTAPLAVSVTANAAEPVDGGQVVFAGLSLPGPGMSPSVITTTIGPEGRVSQGVTANTTPGGPYTVTASARGAAPSIVFSLSNLSRPVALVTAALQTVKSGAPVSLDGSGSYDPDVHLPLAFEWVQTGGPPVSLSSASASQPTFIAPRVALGTLPLTFTLVVTNAINAVSTPAQVVITVEPYRAFVSAVSSGGGLSYHAYISAVLKP